MENFFIIDGNSLINRAFYALPLLSNSEGEYSNAVYGFCNILTKLILENQVDNLVCVFDMKAKTFRHKMYSEYKANRKAMPEELNSQIPILKEMLRLMGIKIIEKEGYEADDIIGTLSKNQKTKNYIITGDRDSLQLISNNCEVWLTKKGISEIEKLDLDGLYNKFALLPYQIVELKALMGDSSDNIPGVKGIGEKTALSLLYKYQNIDNLYENIDEITGKLKEKLIDGKEMCFLSKTLATIDTNVPLDEKIEEAKFNFPFSNDVANFFKKYEFKSLLNKKELFLTEPYIEEKIVNIKEKFIDTEEELDILLEDLKRNNPFSIHISENMHISNSKFEENIIIIKNDLLSASGFSLEFLLIRLKEILENSDIKKICFDTKSYYHFFKQYGIKLQGVVFDVLLADYLIKCGKPREKDCDILCKKENYKKENVASCLFYLYQKYSKTIEELDMNFLYYNIEMPLINVLADMEDCGFKLDFETLQKLNREYLDELKDLNEQIITLAGEKFNINSPKQLATILFDKLGLPNKAKNSTNIEVLENLLNIHPIIELIIRYRKISKLNSTYIESYLDKIDKSTNLVHTVFNQMLTQTGRLSSTEPNLQNIPIREEEGRNLRKIFISRFDDGKIISADYSQIELRLLAHFSNDEKLINSFENGIDIHAQTASEIFGLPLSLVSGELRRKAKAVNFGIIYGISDYGLSQNIHSTRQEAKIFIEKYFASFPQVKNYLDSSVEFAKENGYVKTLFNRRRIIEELKSTNHNTKQFGERVALNMPLQGTASDIIKLAMIEIEKEFKKQNLKSKLILQIHDELIVDAQKDEVELIKQIMREKMENVVKLRVKLEVNIAEGENLFEAKD